MRARTRRLKSLLVGIVSVLWSGREHTPPSSDAARRHKGSRDADPGVCPPLPHADPRWGRVDEVGRGSPPAPPACLRAGRMARPPPPAQPSAPVARRIKMSPPKGGAVPRTLIRQAVLSAALAVPVAAQSVHPTPPPETRAVPLQEEI